VAHFSVLFLRELPGTGKTEQLFAHCSIQVIGNRSGRVRSGGGNAGATLTGHRAGIKLSRVSGMSACLLTTQQLHREANRIESFTEIRLNSSARTLQPAAWTMGTNAAGKLAVRGGVTALWRN
jgi:hypothetical protein